MPKHSNLLSLGEQLKSLREQAGLSIEDLANKTGIQKKHLEWLEGEQFDLLPPAVYVRGFVIRWAEACASEAQDVLLQFERMNALVLRARNKERAWRLPTPPFVITGRMLVLALLATFAVFGASYLGLRYASISGAPSIEIISPFNLEEVASSEWLVVEGNSRNLKSLVVSGREVAMEENGSFRANIALNEGVNTVRIEGEGRNGEKVEVLRKVIWIK